MEQAKVNPTNQFQPSPVRCNSAWLAGRIALIFSAYRKDDWSDPEGFMTQLGLNLEQFPPGIVEYVTDPITGIQTRSKWPPALAEVIEACRAELEHRTKVAKYSALPPVDQLPRPKYNAQDNYDEMVKKHGRPIGVFEPGRLIPYRG